MVTKINEQTKKYMKLIKEYINDSYINNFREPIEGIFKYPYIVPGGNSYSKQLWDWDAWLTGYALMSINDKKIEQHQKGCVLNYLDHQEENGMIPIVISDAPVCWLPTLNDDYQGNIHKPCLAIHAYEISKQYNDYEWIKDEFDKLIKFISIYEKNQYDEESGLFYWNDDLAIGFDNDPTVFYRPNKSTGAIYLNSLMYRELYSIAMIAKNINKEDIYVEFINKANHLKDAINNECFDNVDGFYYSVDLSLRKVDKNEWLHQGQPRFWHSLPIKITTWAGLLPLWNNIASQEQADRVIQRYLNSDGLYSDYGIRSVAKNEKMYGVFDTGNPSCWIGPIWINANYFAYEAFKNYHYDDLAKDIAIKTINLLGKDLETNKQFHEYYDGETGLGVRGLGFQSWNFLVLRMINDLEKDNN